MVKRHLKEDLESSRQFLGSLLLLLLRRRGLQSALHREEVGIRPGELSALDDVALMWRLPFFVLLGETTKRNRTIALRIAVAVLIGHWLDLYVSIVPAHAPEPRLNGWELALGLGAFAAVGWAVTRRERPIAAVAVPVIAVKGGGEARKCIA